MVPNRTGPDAEAGPPQCLGPFSVVVTEYNLNNLQRIRFILIMVLEARRSKVGG